MPGPRVTTSYGAAVVILGLWALRENGKLPAIFVIIYAGIVCVLLVRTANVLASKRSIRPEANLLLALSLWLASWASAGSAAGANGVSGAVWFYAAVLFFMIATGLTLGASSRVRHDKQRLRQQMP